MTETTDTLKQMAQEAEDQIKPEQSNPEQFKQRWERFTRNWQDQVSFLTTEDLRKILDGEPITKANLEWLKSEGIIGKLEINPKLPLVCAALLFNIEPDLVLQLMVNPAVIEKEAEDSPSA